MRLICSFQKKRKAMELHPCIRRERHVGLGPRTERSRYSSSVASSTFRETLDCGPPSHGPGPATGWQIGGGSGPGVGRGTGSRYGVRDQVLVQEVWGGSSGPGMGWRTRSRYRAWGSGPGTKQGDLVRFTDISIGPLWAQVLPEEYWDRPTGKGAKGEASSVSP